MKKTTKKSLRLSRETIRTLQNDLKTVAGAAGTSLCSIQQPGCPSIGQCTTLNISCMPFGCGAQTDECQLY